MKEYQASEIESIEIINAPDDMVDITVEDDHTYWVSTNGDDWVLTHNTSAPDIDTDVGDRDILINAARELYGEDAVIPVSNFNTLKLKSLLKDISSFYNIPASEVFSLTKGLQEEVMPQAKDSNTEKSVFVLKHDDCMKYSKKYRAFMEKYPDVQTHIKALFMQNKSLGRHAGGMIIAPPDELERTMPIIKVRGDLQTPWTEGMNFRNLEDNGFIKFDFLGLTLMEDVRNCIRRILVKEGNPNPTFAEVRSFFDEHLNCRYNEPDDLKVWKTAYHNKDFPPGLFQFTAQGARDFCRNVKPTDITELGAITAIYRPGPLKANVHRKYIKTKAAILRGETITYDHPVIEEILSPTLGYISFQEQFMLLAQKLAGFSPAESDKLRKTLVKKSLDTIGKKGDERAEAREKFVSGAKALHDIPESVSEDLWKKIEFFSVYGFNASLHFLNKQDVYDCAGSHTGTKPIKDVQPGDYVRSRDEVTGNDVLVEVVENHHHGKQPIYEFELDVRKKVRCTMQHKFRVTDGTMRPMWYILQENLDIVVQDVDESMFVEAA